MEEAMKYLDHGIISQWLLATESSQILSHIFGEALDFGMNDIMIHLDAMGYLLSAEGVDLCLLSTQKYAIYNNQ